jgi:ribosomal protein S18 acetylase RimI-like enzyme
MTRAALERCRGGGDRIILVVGHPTYYPRFGFAADLAKHLQLPFELEVPGAFMALELQPNALCGIRGRVRYPEGFGLPEGWTMQPGSAMAIRRFEDLDEMDTVDVWRRSGKAAYPYLPLWQTLTRTKALEIFRREIKAQCDIWVALKRRRVVAFLALRGSYIDRMYVDPDSQRMGCGTLLVDFAKRISPEGLRLYTHQQNRCARAFYEKHGFTAIRFGTSPAPESAPDVEYHWSGIQQN